MNTLHQPSVHIRQNTRLAQNHVTFRRQQQGMALILAMIALVAISLASLALVRSVDTSNVVAGNVSTNETTIQMAELGTQAVKDCLLTNANCPIYQDVRPLDPTTRLPTDPKINANPPDAAAVTLAWTSVTSPDSSYKIEYVIERMCGTVVGGTTSNYAAAITLTTAVAPLFSNCIVSPVYDPVLGLGRLFYRATVQVTGPKNTRAVNSTFIGQDFPGTIQ